VVVSPTILRIGGYRLYFFSREERRIHVHVQRAGGEAKFWIDPEIALAVNHGLSPQSLARARRLVEEHEDEIRRAWKAYFGG
jgi:hypothetical protein